MTKELATLPEEVVTQLKDLREAQDYTALHDFTATLRKQGWPLRAIATPLGVSRSAVRNWEVAGTAEQKTDVPSPPKTVHGSKTRKVKIPRDVPQSDRDRLRSLAETARSRTRWSNANSPEYRASEELDSLVAKYAARKVPLATIARHMGVTRRAVAQRLEKTV